MVVTDTITPNKEGVETIMQIRVRAPRTPIPAMSGGGRLGNADFLAMAAKVGANATLPKPFECRELIAAVPRLLAT
ncbi:MAG: hypothetical protein JWL84_4488 [Rhodospirillales bacterium]|nr:hypothetical protein [Rhodospirillales bacterium]